jgi:adenosylcobinamide kinase/adenosylcobinamide-phosphate guanylyltransferase
MYTFVIGGYRSGRSNYALRRASELGPPPWLYVATVGETDDSVRKRIERHRKDHEAIWRTTIMPSKLLGLVQGPALDGLGAAVFDGISWWIESHLASSPPENDKTILTEIAGMAERMYRHPVPIVVVSTEMALGAVPTDEPQLRLLKVLTSANQILAEQAGAVVLMVSGVPLRVR